MSPIHSTAVSNAGSGVPLSITCVSPAALGLATRGARSRNPPPAPVPARLAAGQSGADGPGQDRSAAPAPPPRRALDWLQLCTRLPSAARRRAQRRPEAPASKRSLEGPAPPIGLFRPDPGGGPAAR